MPRLQSFSPQAVQVFARRLSIAAFTVMRSVTLG